ncbi:MAG: helix-hairpin-helix domain-containing protein [Lachnospiraceae bacterium]|nr:helix-hairpin-helix domain-containing protein [Lachnospiraceae bacterium]
MKRDKLITIIICCVFVLMAGIFYFNSGTSSVQNEASITKKEVSSVNHSTEQTPASKEIAVYICGAVKKPGVYKFNTASRVCDAVKAAGGFKKNADTISINQAQYLKDGEQITIPKKTNVKPGSSGDGKSDSNNSKASSNLVNINQADENELMTLPGVGESKAASIIEYRNKNGYFTKIEDIMKITGIKEGVFNKIKDKITI